MDNGAASLAELEAAFADCGYTFRHFDCEAAPFMSWQCGRKVLVEVELPSGYWTFAERFELVAFAATRSALIDKLALLDGQ